MLLSQESTTLHSTLFQKLKDVSYVEALGAWNPHCSGGSSGSDGPCRSWTSVLTRGALNKRKVVTMTPGDIDPQKTSYRTETHQRSWLAFCSLDSGGASESLLEKTSQIVSINLVTEQIKRCFMTK